MVAAGMVRVAGASLFWLMLAGVGSAVGQQGAAVQAPMRMGTGDVAPEKLPPPVAMTGIGNSSMKITTSSAQAQVWFTQGLNLLHDFWDYESLRAFEESVRLDPKCAMCYWGLYQAESMRGEDDAWAATALTQAVAYSKGASAAERLYIKAAVEEQKAKVEAKQKEAKQKEAEAKKKKPGKKPGGAIAAAGLVDVAHKDSKETKTLRKLVAKEPGDVQGNIFLAESVMDGFDKQGLPKPGTIEGQQILRELLAEHPDDTAVNHYWIHAVEPGGHPEFALGSARRLGRLAPASGHMVHMPGHIFYRTGDYETARVAFENSMHVDEAYMRAQQVGVDDDWNYVHNLMYLIADLLEAGRMAEAAKISEKLNAARGESNVTLYRFSTRDGLTRLDVELPVALRAGDWTRASAMLEASKPAAELKNLAALRVSLLEYTQGMEALVRGDVAGAERLSAALEARVKEKPAEEPMAGMPGMVVSKDAEAGPLHSYLDVASLELRACVLLAEGKSADADAAFAKAADAEAELGYREPPYYIRPVGETRGDALMRAGRYGDAKKAYEAALLERPNSGYPLYGIAQADVALKNTAAARADYEAFEKAWAKADAGLPQVLAAKAWLAAH